MASSISRASWVQLYKDLQRAACEFPQFSYREFSKRRIREYFVQNRTVNDQEELVKLYKFGKDQLAAIKRQTTISKLLPTSKLVIEQ
uniref:Complex1_LYR_dom domain-containing protein n=1 Tax=Steinernema glaseri TaxID=37863 RepID=A0A1I7YUM7_9BILA